MAGLIGVGEALVKDATMTGGYSSEPFMTSDVALERNSQAVAQPGEYMTADEWYNRVNGISLDSDSLRFLTQNTKDVYDYLELPYTENDIKAALNNGNLKALDKTLIDNYNRKRNDILVQRLIDINALPTVEEKRKALQQYKKWEELNPDITIDQVVDLRSYLAAKQKAKFVSDYNKEATQDFIEKTQYLAQIQNKLKETRTQREALEGFADLSEQTSSAIVPGVMSIETEIIHKSLEDRLPADLKEKYKDFMNRTMAQAEKDIIREGFTLTNLAELVAGSIVEFKDTLLTGEFNQKLKEFAYGLSVEDFKKLIDTIDTDPVLNRNLLVKDQILSIFTTSSAANNIYTGLDVLNILTTPKQIKEGLKHFRKSDNSIAKGTPYIPAEPSKRPPPLAKEPPIKDLDYTYINPRKIETVSDVGTLKVEKGTRFRKAVNADDSVFNIKYQYFDNVDEVISDMKAHPNSIYQTVPAWDTRSRGLHTVDVIEDTYSIEHGGYNSFKTKAELDTIRKQIMKTEEVADAYASGSDVVGDMRSGAGTSAAIKMENKMASGEGLTLEETFTFNSDVAAGAKRNTVANAKTPDMVEALQRDPALMSQEELSKVVGNRHTPMDYDPEAFEQIRNKLRAEAEELAEAFKKEKLDLRVSKISTETDPEGQGIKLKEVFGFGDQNSNSLDGFTKDKVQKLLGPNNEFKVEELEDGSLWLTREMFLPYGDEIATKMQNENASLIKPYITSIKSVGFDDDAVNQIYLSVAEAAGTRGMTNNLIQRYSKLNKKDKLLVDTIYKIETNRDSLMSMEEVFEIAGADRGAKIWDAISDLRTLELANESLFNYSIRSAMLRQGYQYFSIDNAFVSNISEINSGFIAKKLTKPSERTLENSFFEYYGTSLKEGTIIGPQDKLPFNSLDDVDVYILRTPVYAGTDKVEYVVTPKNFMAMKVNPLPDRVIGHSTHASLGYKDKYWISFPRTVKNSNNNPVAYNKSVFTAATAKEAKAYVDKTKEILGIMKKVDDGVMTVSEANNRISEIALKGPYTLTGDLSSYKGWDDYLKLHKMEDLKTTEAASKLGFRYDSFIAYDTVDVDGNLVAASNEASRWHRGKERVLNPGYSASIAQTENVSKYINKIQSQAAYFGNIDPVVQVQAERFWATYSHMRNPDIRVPNKVEFFLNPRAYISKAAETAPLSKYSEAINYSDMAKRALNVRATNGKFNTLLNKYIDKWVLNGSDIISGGAEKLRKFHPIDFAQDLLYWKTFSFRLDQYAIQTWLTTVESMGALPGNTGKGLQWFYPTNYLVDMLSRGEDITEAAAQIARKHNLGRSADDLIAMAKQYYRTGSHVTSFNDIRKGQLWPKIEAYTMAPFNRGNRDARTLAFGTAVSRVEDKLGKTASQFTTNDWASVSVLQDTLSGGSSRANARLITSGFMKPLTTMTSFSSNQLELLFGDAGKLTGKEKARLMAVLLGMYGLQTFTSPRTARKYGMQVEDITGSEAAGQWVAVGGLGMLLSYLAGYDVDASGYSPNVLDNVWTRVTDVVTQEHGENVPFLVGSLVTLFGEKGPEAFQYFVDAEDEGSLNNLTPTEKMEALAGTAISLFPGLQKGKKVWYATKLQQYINSHGQDMIPLGGDRSDVGKKAWNEFFLGFRPAVETQLNKYAAMDYEQSVLEDYRETVAEASKAQKQANLLALRGAQDEANLWFRKAQHIITLGSNGMPAATKLNLRKEVYENGIKKLNPSDRTLIRKLSNPLLMDSEALQKYYKNQIK